MYPLAIVLIALALAGGAFGYDRVVLAWAEGLTLPAALLGAAGSAPAVLAGTPVVRAMSRVAAVLPLAAWGFGWVVPAAVGLGVGLAVHVTRARGNVPSL
jgi:LIVCS family branched-chain amino acid:cation transporter